MEYKVIKEFGCAQKGDIFTENENGDFELVVENLCDDMHCVRAMCISADIADTLVSSEHLLENDEETQTICECEDKLNRLLEFVEEKLVQYENDHQALVDQYNDGFVPQCVKVEADTVYFNLNKVLTAIKNIINE